MVRAICTAAPGVVVVDEAYAEFARPGTPSALELLREFPRLAVSRTMSKAFAFAGGRLGYLAATPAFVDALRIVRLPYHLSTVTQAVARVALAHAEEMLAAVDRLRTARDDLAGWLAGQGLQVADSDANFVLFGRFADRHAVWQGLLDRGVLIREVGPPGWLRVSAGTPEEMAAFRRRWPRYGTERQRRAHEQGPTDRASGAARRPSRACGSAWTWTAPARPRSRPAWGSTTTC